MQSSSRNNTAGQRTETVRRSRTDPPRALAQYIKYPEMNAKVRSNYAWVRIGHTRRHRLRRPVAQLPCPARTSNADAVRAGHHSGDPPGRQGQPIEIFVPPTRRVFRGPRFRMLHRDGWDGLRSIVGGKGTALDDSQRQPTPAGPLKHATPRHLGKLVKTWEMRPIDSRATRSHAGPRGTTRSGGGFKWLMIHSDRCCRKASYKKTHSRHSLDAPPTALAMP